MAFGRTLRSRNSGAVGAPILRRYLSGTPSAQSADGLTIDEVGTYHGDKLERLRPANRDVMKDMQRARWSAHDVLQMLVNMHAKDYKKSEWARIDAGRRWVPCDVYLTLYDSFTRRRCPNAPSVYLKFSIDEAGDVTILLASCHGST